MIVFSNVIWNSLALHFILIDVKTYSTVVGWQVILCENVV